MVPSRKKICQKISRHDSDSRKINLRDMYLLNLAKISQKSKINRLIGEVPTHKTVSENCHFETIPRKDSQYT